MDITLTDNKNGTYTLTDEDRATLITAFLITPNYKGGDNAASYDLQALDSSAKVYSATDITAQKQAIQQQIDDLQIKLDQVTAIEAATVDITPVKEPPVLEPPIDSTPVDSGISTLTV